MTVPTAVGDQTPDRTDIAAGSVADVLGFVAMCVGMFMAILDVQVVATSLPAIQEALGIEPAAMTWVQTAYLVAEVIAIPLTGLLTRALTMRWLFVLAVSLFTGASIGCATSSGLVPLIAWRTVQGFAGGTLIPSVFSAVFLLFPPKRQGVATTLAGVLAVLAPTVGPVVGGWITQTWAWHWLFLINVAPGILAAICAALLLPRHAIAPRRLLGIDLVALALLASGLAALEIGLTQAPDRGWLSGPVLGLVCYSVASATAFVRRTLRAARPIIDLRLLGDRAFVMGCILSFVLGIGLFGTVYLMPVFLALVRGHNPLEIGKIMLVTGVAQLCTAPLAVLLDRRVDGRILTLFGFVLFGVGLGFSAYDGRSADYDAMFWPQVIRGCAIMFCLLPPTRLALGHLAPARVPDASGLFNLMRNLGGAVGLALIGSLVFGRAPAIGRGILERLAAGDAATARDLGIPLSALQNGGAGDLAPGLRAMLDQLVGRSALATAIGEAWALVAALTLTAVATLLFVGSSQSRQEAQVSDVRSES